MPTTAGFLARLVPGGLMRARTLTAGSGIAITDPTGGSGDPTFTVTPQICMVGNSAGGTLNVAHQTIVPVTFNTDVYDPNNLHSTSSNTSRIVAALAGKYLLTGGLFWTASAGSNTGGILLTTFLKNGSIIDGSRSYFPPIGKYATDGQAQNVSIVVSLAVSDYVELAAYQDQTGGGATLTVTLDSSTFQCTWISP